MAAYGIPEVDIARVLGVSKPTLRKHCGTELDTGLELLRAAVEEAGTSRPEELCDRVLARLTGVHRADDIALLVLTRAG